MLSSSTVNLKESAEKCQVKEKAVTAPQAQKLSSKTSDPKLVYMTPLIQL